MFEPSGHPRQRRHQPRQLQASAGLYQCPKRCAFEGPRHPSPTSRARKSYHRAPAASRRPSPWSRCDGRDGHRASSHGSAGIPSTEMPRPPAVRMLIGTPFPAIGLDHHPRHAARRTLLDRPLKAQAPCRAGAASRPATGAARRHVGRRISRSDGATPAPMVTMGTVDIDIAAPGTTMAQRRGRGRSASPPSDVHVADGRHKSSVAIHQHLRRQPRRAHHGGRRLRGLPQMSSRQLEARAAEKLQCAPGGHRSMPSRRVTRRVKSGPIHHPGHDRYARDITEGAIIGQRGVDQTAAWHGDRRAGGGCRGRPRHGAR